MALRFFANTRSASIGCATIRASDRADRARRLTNEKGEIA